MHILKQFARGLSSQAFKLALLFTAISAATVVVFGTPTHLKDALRDSGVYQKAVDSAIDHTKKDQNNVESGLPLDDPEVRQAINEALPPEFIEQTTVGAIDGIFGWLQGRTETPQFNVDLNEAKQRVATAIGNVAYGRVSALPQCTLDQLRTLDINSADIFSLPCLPPGVDLRAEQANLEQQILASDEILKDASFTPEDLPRENGQTVFDRAAAVPDIYQWLVRLPWILGGLALLSAACLVLLHDDRRRGLIVVGRTLLITGVILVLGALLLNYLAGLLRPEANGGIETTLPEIARILSQKINRVLYIFGGAYGVTGVIVLLAIRLTRPKAPKAVTNSAEAAKEPSSEFSTNTIIPSGPTAPKSPEDKVE